MWCSKQQFGKNPRNLPLNSLILLMRKSGNLSSFHCMLEIQVLVNIFLSYIMNPSQLGKNECFGEHFSCCPSGAQSHTSSLLNRSMCIQCNCAFLTVKSSNNGLFQTEDLRNSSICSMSCGLPNLSRFGSGL